MQVNDKIMKIDEEQIKLKNEQAIIQNHNGKKLQLSIRKC